MWIQQPGDDDHFVVFHWGEEFLDNFFTKEDVAALSGFPGFWLKFWRAGMDTWTVLGALLWAPPAPELLGHACTTQVAWRPIPLFPTAGQSSVSVFINSTVNAKLLCSLPTWSCLLATGT